MPISLVCIERFTKTNPVNAFQAPYSPLPANLEGFSQSLLKPDVQKFIQAEESVWIRARGRRLGKGVLRLMVVPGVKQLVPVSSQSLL